MKRIMKRIIGFIIGLIGAILLMIDNITSYLKHKKQRRKK